MSIHSSGIILRRFRLARPGPVQTPMTGLLLAHLGQFAALIRPLLYFKAILTRLVVLPQSNLRRELTLRMFFLLGMFQAVATRFQSIHLVTSRLSMSARVLLWALATAGYSL